MNTHLALFAAFCTLGFAASAQRLSPPQLQALFDQGEPVTLIDLRAPDAYAKGSLPDALQMSARQALEKNLTGHVVFFDDGLGLNRAKRAVAAFSAAGKTASELAGGLAAWKAAGLPTTQTKGLSARTADYVTYQNLTGSLVQDADDIVLIDVRETAATPLKTATLNAAVTTTNSLDLAAEFPAFRVARLGGGVQTSFAKTAVATGNDQPLYVLIDAGDGTAERKAAELRASGCVRVVVLAGGETIIRRKGQPSLVRRGPGAGLAADQPADLRNAATLIKEVTP